MLTVEQIKDEASHCGFIGSVEQLVEFVRRIEAVSNPPESGGFKTVEIDGIKPEQFAQQIAAAMRYADAPLTHDQFVVLVLYLKARFDGGADNTNVTGLAPEKGNEE